MFRLLGPEHFHAWFLGFMKRFAETCQRVVAIDGKTLRRSFDRASGCSALHMVNAWAVDQRLVLGQLAVDDKSNEIVAVPGLLDLLSLKGRIVTADAMSCQRKIAEDVIERKADYVLALKGNQGTLHDDVRLFLDDPETALDSATKLDKGHGRIETRTLLNCESMLARKALSQPARLSFPRMEPFEGSSLARLSASLRNRARLCGPWSLRFLA